MNWFLCLSMILFMPKFFHSVFILFACSFYLSFASQAAPPRLDAGATQSIYLPKNQARLVGFVREYSGKINFRWRLLTGGKDVIISSVTSATTDIKNLRKGTYIFECTATLATGANLHDTTSVMVFETANSKIPSSDDYPNLLGSNPGYYGGAWTDKLVYKMMAKAGCGSTRSTIPMFFFKYYGDSIRYREFKYFYDTLGFRENVFFLYNNPGADYPDQSEETFNGERSVVPKGLYQPIWNKNGSVNVNNTFANYCFKSVTVYGKFLKYYEIWNEPDFTGNWGAAGGVRGTPGNWWENDPKPTDLANLKAPGQYYVRMLRVAFEVIKRYQPDAIITLGGVGYLSFLDFVMRNTDNPHVDKNGKKGSRTDAFPLTGGAYFDCLSFHNYPEFYLKYWDYTTGAMGYKRNSDEAIDHVMREKDKFEKVLKNFGYNGKLHPAKPFICTEINIPRKQIQQDIGGIDVQRNFTWKTIAQSARNNIKQVYWFVTAETADYENGNDAFKLMGLVKNVLNIRPGREQLTEQGIANKSARLLLNNFFYDSSITKELNLPPNIEGAAWKNRQTGEVRFMLWAKTTKDLDESSEAFYSFPNKYASKKMEMFLPDYAVTNASSGTVDPTGIKLNGEPVIFIPATTTSEKKFLGAGKPIISAGVDTIIHQQFLVLHGKVKEGTSRCNYYWDLVRLPTSQGDYPALKNRNTLNPALMGLQKGVYGVRFTATNEFGSFSTDTVWIAVDTTISFSNNLSDLQLTQLCINSPMQRIFEPELLSIGEAEMLRNPNLFVRKH